MMEIPQPALLKIIVVFSALLVMNRKLPLYVCLAFISVLMGLWMKMDTLSIFRSMAIEAFSPPTLILSVVITLIVVFSGLLKRSGRLDSIVSSLRALSTRAGVSLVLAPALIGLLPMPGGAVFSAPMIETALGDVRVKPESKLAINYWFRHVPEFSWPLYPGFILSLSIFGLEAWRLTLFQIPLSIGAIAAGLLFVLPKIPSASEEMGNSSPGAIMHFLREVSPILLVLFLMFALQGGAEVLRLLTGISIPLSQHLSMATALAAGILYVTVVSGLHYGDVRSAFLESGILSIVLMVFAIMAFKGILEESHTIGQIRSELQAFHIPETFVIALLPLIAGLVTGIAVGFVGSSFPLVATLAPPNEHIMPYVVLAYGFGFIGMMLSPVHLCFLVTQEYFHTNALDSYRQFWKAAVFLTLWVVVVFLIYRLAA